MRVVSVAADIAARERVRRSEPPFPLVFPESLIDAATEHLRRQGVQGNEELVLFAGVPVDDRVLITSLLMPDTIATWGHVEIVRSEQPLIAEWLVRNHQLLFVEMHTHGGRSAWSTRISSVDTAHPVSVRNGFLTVIVPAHAEDGIDFAVAGVWECMQLSWRRLSKRDVGSRFTVVPDQEVQREVA